MTLQPLLSKIKAWGMKQLMFSYLQAASHSMAVSDRARWRVHDRKEEQSRSGFPVLWFYPHPNISYFLFCIPSPSSFSLLSLLFLVALGLRCWVWAFSSCREQGLLRVRCTGFSLLPLLPLQSTVSKCLGFVAVDSSRTRDRTHIPRIGRWTPNHWATRKALSPSFVCTA